MPNRIIKESCRTSVTLDQLSDGAERLFWRLTTVADDFGRFECDPRVLLANCFPLKVGVLPIDKIESWLSELVTCCLVTTYVVKGKHLAFFNTWHVHQRRRATFSKYSGPELADIRGHLLSNDSDSRTSAVIRGHPPQNASEERGIESEESRNEERGIESESEARQHLTANDSKEESKRRKNRRKQVVEPVNQSEPPDIEFPDEAELKALKIACGIIEADEEEQEG